MIIRMTLAMSGGRYDDRQWPAPGINFEVPEAEGRGLIRCGAALEVEMPAAQATVATATGTAPSLTAAEIAEAQAQHAAKTGPAPGDPKAAWVDHAVNQGLSRDEAEAMTKVQLQQGYGGRL
jgi:hypothetical protein